MTYCVGIEVDEGLVFAADTRTSASFDDVRVYRKMHIFEYPGDRVFVIMSAGNLATTQLTISRLQRDADDPQATRSKEFRFFMVFSPELRNGKGEDGISDDRSGGL